MLKPDNETKSLFVRLCGEVAKATYVLSESKEEISNRDMLVVATLILLTTFPRISDTFAFAFLVYAYSSKVIASPTLYPEPPVIIPIESILPLEDSLMFIVCETYFIWLEKEIIVTPIIV